MPTKVHWGIAGPATLDSLVKLNPRKMVGKPVMFVVKVGPRNRV